jgi:glycine betaine transporter
MFGLLVSYHLYRKKRSILSSAILEDRFQKPIFTIPIDTITVISTLLGVVAAVGLGSRQVLEGFAFMAGVAAYPPGYAVFVVLGIGFLATFSAYMGVSKGIRIISNLNISLALLLLVFTLAYSNLEVLAGTFFRSLVGYLWNFDLMSLNLGQSKVEKAFLMEWTYFYWAFWLAWAPFTGVFIARISKGRSIRTFILGALLVPSLGTFFWFSVFGSQAFEYIRQMDAYQGEFDSIYTGIFRFLKTLPASTFTGWVTLILVSTFLITSIDSAIFVLGMFSDKGREEPQKRLRLFWGGALVVSTIAVILIGKEELLQAVSNLLMLFALPFSLLFLGMILYFVYKLMKKAA